LGFSGFIPSREITIWNKKCPSVFFAENALPPPPGFQIAVLKSQTHRYKFCLCDLAQLTEQDPDFIEMVAQELFASTSTEESLETRMHIAVQLSDCGTVASFLDQGADVNANSEQFLGCGGSWTCLHSAVKLGNTEMIDVLLSHGADTERESSNGFTPLHVAAQQGEIEAGKQLLEHGASVEAKTTVGTTPLLMAAKSGNREFCAMMVEHLAASIDIDEGRAGFPTVGASDEGASVPTIVVSDEGASIHTVLAKNEGADVHTVVVSDEGAGVSTFGASDEGPSVPTVRMANEGVKVANLDPALTSTLTLFNEHDSLCDAARKADPAWRSRETEYEAVEGLDIDKTTGVETMIVYHTVHEKYYCELLCLCHAGRWSEAIAIVPKYLRESQRIWLRLDLLLCIQAIGQFAEPVGLDLNGVVYQCREMTDGQAYKQMVLLLTKAASLSNGRWHDDYCAVNANLVVKYCAALTHKRMLHLGEVFVNAGALGRRVYECTPGHEEELMRVWIDRMRLTKKLAPLTQHARLGAEECEGELTPSVVMDLDRTDLSLPLSALT
jgi:hypothetical protein